VSIQQNNNQYQYRTRINGFIRVPQVRVILDDGSSPGIMNTWEALKMAQDMGVDMVEINPKAQPPVVRLTDFGKLKYEEKKKQAEAKKKQKEQELKEITLRPNTDTGDLHHKLTHIKEFLAEGDRVKITIRFRGREMAHPEVGQEKMEWFIDQLSGLIQASPPVFFEGKFMHLTLAPAK
jgi:translation initiation factor IF-3